MAFCHSDFVVTGWRDVCSIVTSQVRECGLAWRSGEWLALITDCL